VDTTFTTTVLGYPRIGPRRELKRAVESYWAGRIGVEKPRKSRPSCAATPGRSLASRWTRCRATRSPSTTQMLDRPA